MCRGMCLNFLACCINTGGNITQYKDLENDHDMSLLLKVSSNLELLVKQFSNATPEKGNDPERIDSSKYYDIDEMHNTEIPSLFHINACSHNKNFDDCQHFDDFQFFLIFFMYLFIF